MNAYSDLARQQRQSDMAEIGYHYNYLVNLTSFGGKLCAACNKLKVFDNIAELLFSSELKFQIDSLTLGMLSNGKLSDSS